MNADVVRLLMLAEVGRVERFIARCERERRESASRAPIPCCDYCDRAAMPGQFSCTNCLTPETVGLD